MTMTDAIPVTVLTGDLGAGTTTVLLMAHWIGPGSRRKLARISGCSSVVGGESMNVQDAFKAGVVDSDA